MTLLSGVDCIYNFTNDNSPIQNICAKISMIIKCNLQVVKILIIFKNKGLVKKLRQREVEVNIGANRKVSRGVATSEQPI